MPDVRPLAIAYGASRQAKTWVNKTFSFSDLKKRLRVPVRTSETAEEYAHMDSKAREEAKDHGGFVAGVLIGGRRKVDSVQCRSMVTLDGDHISPEFLSSFVENMPFAALLYTTHSHTPESPRARVIIPLLRDVSPEEYIAVSRYVAQMLGIDYFDPCSYLCNQLMYWPSAPMNGEYLFLETGPEKAWLNPDAILLSHPEWRDPTRLPTSARESKANTVNRKKAQDPLEKSGVIGVFNRAYYPIQNAIDTFLPDVYEPTSAPDRYHFIGSASMAGVVVIEDKFVYSHHATDPACMRLCNAFDIVRLHLFGDLGDRESVTAMLHFASEQDAVKLLAAREKREEAATDFGQEGEEDWKKGLTYQSRSMRLENTLQNLMLILENEPELQGIVYNLLADRIEIRGSVPWDTLGACWRDEDDAQLVFWVDKHYGTFSARNYEIALARVADNRRWHPIREMFVSLPPWDGVPRVDTLLIDYLGAEDTPYVRAATRKMLCAACARVFQPGIKFDYMLVLNGAQGIGKSTLIAKLGMSWFSDSLSLSDMNDKTAAEKLQGFWIQEIGELAGMKKADIDKVKAFISRQSDNYRAAFGHRVAAHPRQCVFFGTTNSENGYLRDITGNRRFWNVKVSGHGKYKPWDLNEETVRLIWAETKFLTDQGEQLFLPAELEAFAMKEQKEALEQDEREGVVQEYLDMLLPESWDQMDLWQRREYFREPNDPTRERGKVRRSCVCTMEIWCECFGKKKEDLRPADSYAISAIMLRIEGWHKSTKRPILPIYGRQRVFLREEAGRG